MRPYRRHLVGLPLQRSLFSDIDRAPESISLLGVLPGDRLNAWLDDDGNLFLDRSDIDRVAAALGDRLTAAFAASMQHSLAAACTAVLEATETCRIRAPTVDEEGARTLLRDLGRAVAGLISYGILTKFVPDVLYRGLAATDAGTESVLPEESPGTALTKAAARLCIDCREAGVSAEQLLAEWPAVSAEVEGLVRQFCSSHVGFGPLSWEAPGFEEPRYVLGVLQATFADDEPEDVLHRLAVAAGARATATCEAGPPDAAALRSALAFWLDFLERETWYVRRAFYLGLVPLLRRLVPVYQAVDPGRAPEDLLFLELCELTSPSGDATKAGERRARYLAAHDYLSENAITPDRLGRILVPA